MVVKALIVEDSRLAREDLKRLLLPHSHIQVIGEAGHPDEALQLIEKEQPDLLFLDINMPGKSGFDLLEQLETCPSVIFTTAYSDYAIRSFDYNTVDYLLKPISPERLAKALSKLTDMQHSAAESADSAEPLEADSRIFIKDGERCFLVELVKIRRLESCGNYTRLIFDEGSPLIYKSLSKIEAKLPVRIFFRANRQLIVNLRYINKIDDWVNGGYRAIMNDGTEVEISRRHASRFKALLSL
jgi:two-component system LytT family response regulator